MLKKLVLITFLTVVSLQSYTISLSCNYVSPTCPVSINLNGGPFNNINKCENNAALTQVCSQYNLYTIPGTITFSCSTDSSCSYCYMTAKMYNAAQTLCTDPNNANWISMKNSLDSLYSIYYNQYGYNWCSNACNSNLSGSSGLSGGAIVGIIIGSLFGVVLIIIIVLCCFKIRRNIKNPEENVIPSGSSLQKL